MASQGIKIKFFQIIIYFVYLIADGHSRMQWQEMERQRKRVSLERNKKAGWDLFKIIGYFWFDENILSSQFDQLTDVAAHKRDEEYCNILLKDKGMRVCTTWVAWYNIAMWRYRTNSFHVKCFDIMGEHHNTAAIAHIRFVFIKLDEPNRYPFVEFQFPKIPYRITGLRVMKCEDKYPYFKDYPTHLRIHYKTTYYHLDSWQKYMENGAQKIVRTGGYEREGRDYGGYEYFSVDPPIVTSNLRVFIFHVRKLFFTKCIIFPYGCHDDTSYHEMQRLRGASISVNTLNKQILKLTEFADIQAIQPFYDEGCPIFDFENGVISNWTQKGEAFRQQPTYGDTIFLREKRRLTGINGKWWISSIEIHPHEGAERRVGSRSLEGVVTSPLFEISSTKISFLIGGGTLDDSKVGMELLVRGRKVREFFIRNQQWETLQRHEMDVSEFFRQPARIRLFDDSVKGYLMFDDLRTVERCKDVCSRAIGMESEEISDSKITGGKPLIHENKMVLKKHKLVLEDPRYKPHHARLTGDRDKKEVFRVPMEPFVENSDERWNDYNPAPFLKIDLSTIHMLDGWSTQDHTDCSLETYTVRYSVDDISYRYISAKMLVKNLPSPFPVGIKFRHEKGKIIRTWLDPRVRAKTVQFVILSSPTTDGTACLRVELYGCPIYKMHKYDMSRIEIDEKYKTFAEKNEKLEERYAVQIVNVKGKLWFVNLYCLQKDDIRMKLLDVKFAWKEIVFNSNISLNSCTENKCKYTIHNKFMSKTVRCEVFNKDYSVLLFTKDLFLTEKNEKLVVPFVTQEPGIEYRGGPLVYSNPAVILNSGHGGMFLSVHLTNLVYPQFVGIDKEICPLKNAHHRAYEGYDRCAEPDWENGYIKPLVQQLEKILQKGHRYYYTDKESLSVCSGPAIFTWFQSTKEKTCDSIFSKYDKEYGSSCQKSCNKIQPNKDEKYRLYAIKYGSLFDTIIIKLELNGKIFFEKEYKLPYVEKDDKNQTVAISPSNIFNNLEYNDCQSSKKISPIYGGCASYFSQYSSKEHGFGSIATFTYLFRSAETLKMIPSYPQIIIHGEYKRKNRVGKKFKKYITIKHASKPVITLDKHIGICKGSDRVIAPNAHISEPSFIDRAIFNYKWKKVTLETFDEKEKLDDVNNVESIQIDREKMVIFNASSIHRGTYEFKVETPFGTSYARTTLEVYSDYPMITYTLPSPHVVVSGKSDVLRIETNTNKHIKSIEWLKDNEKIKESPNYNFIDNDGEAYQKKRLLLKNLNSRNLNGHYVIKLEGEYCSFQTFIDVVVHHTPVVRLKPNIGGRGYVLVKDGATLTITAEISGYAKLEHFKWYKGSVQMMNTKNGPIKIRVSRLKATQWSSKLVIHPFTSNDQGIYRFVVDIGHSKVTRERKALVEKGSIKSTTGLNSNKQTTRRSASCAALYVQSMMFTMLLVTVAISCG